METTASRPVTCTQTVRRAIEIERTLSPTMREAARQASKNHEGRWVVVGRRNTLSALESRGMISGYFTRRVAELNDFGRIVHAVTVKGEVETLAWAEQKDAETPQPRTPHKNADDTAGTTHRVDFHGRAMCDETIQTVSNVGRRVTCRSCIDAMYPGNDQWSRSRREEWYAAAEAEEGRQLAAEFLSCDVTDRHRGERIDIGDRDNPMVRAFRAVVMDALHARALAEKGYRRAAELIASGADEHAIGARLDEDRR